MKISTLLLAALLGTGVAVAQTERQNQTSSPSRTSQNQSVQQTPRATPATPNVQASGQEMQKQQLKVQPDVLHKEVTDANKASKIIGKEIRNLQNERVGKVKDIVLDMQEGKVGYAVMSAGGGLFGGGKLIAVPLDALSLKPGEDHLVINAPKDRLAAAPGFSEDNWPSIDSGGDRTIGLSASTDESTRQKALEEADDDDRMDRDRVRTNRSTPPPRENEPRQ
jgi:sporulation protein YlmC with PRC-barrel domain